MPCRSAAYFAGTPILSAAQMPSWTAGVSFVVVPTGRPFLLLGFLLGMSALGFATGELFPALDGNIDVQRVKLDGDATAIKRLRSDDSRTRPAERLVDQCPRCTAVFDELLKHLDGFHRGMQLGRGRTWILEYVVAPESTVEPVTLRPTVDRELRTLELILGRKT